MYNYELICAAGLFLFELTFLWCMVVLCNDYLDCEMLCRQASVGEQASMHWPCAERSRASLLKQQNTAKSILPS